MSKENMSDVIQILCYGDSNTWGCIGRWVDDGLPARRFAPDERWPNVVQADLGENVHVISEGLGGRTTVYPVDGQEWMSGEFYLEPCLYTHQPLDLVIIMLGTNDLSAKKDMTESELPLGISRLADLVLETGWVGRDVCPPKLLIIAPPEIMSSAPEGRTYIYAKFRSEIGRALSLKFPEVYAQVAREKNCYFLNAQDYVKPGPADGIHLEAKDQISLGHAISAYIRENIYPCLL